MTRQQAILLVGPTGAGKSPLGDWLQARGLWGRRCHHFDFGAKLREVAGGHGNGFTAEEMLFIRNLVGKGALLEDETFYLALRILVEFVGCRQVQPGDLLIMNGLPRHTGQADSMAGYLQFAAIVHLQCSAETVWERLQNDAGGDRADRIDDTVALVEQKLAVFAERTKPLLAWYQRLGVPLIQVAVGAQTRPSEILPLLERMKS